MNTSLIEKLLINRIVYEDITGLILEDGDIALNYTVDEPVYAIVEYAFSNKLNSKSNIFDNPCIVFHTYKLNRKNYRQDVVIKAYDNTNFISCIFSDCQVRLENNSNRRCKLRAVKMNLDMLKQRISNDSIINEFLDIQAKILDVHNKHRYKIIKKSLTDYVLEEQDVFKNKK